MDFECAQSQPVIIEYDDYGVPVKPPVKLDRQAAKRLLTLNDLHFTVEDFVQLCLLEDRRDRRLKPKSEGRDIRVRVPDFQELFYCKYAARKYAELSLPFWSVLWACRARNYDEVLVGPQHPLHSWLPKGQLARLPRKPDFHLPLSKRAQADGREICSC